jgi:hypothetical protein
LNQTSTDSNNNKNKNTNKNKNKNNNNNNNNIIIIIIIIIILTLYCSICKHYSNRKDRKTLIIRGSPPSLTARQATNEVICVQATNEKVVIEIGILEQYHILQRARSLPEASEPRKANKTPPGTCTRTLSS